MKCNNCGKNISDNLSTCPNCGVQIRKIVKNKFIQSNAASKTGGVVSSKSLIKIQKRPERRTEIDRKNYVNYIDYQEAKARSEQNRNKFVSIIGADSANNTGASKSKAKYINDKAVTTGKTTIKKVNNVQKVGSNRKPLKQFKFGYALVFLVILSIGLFILLKDNKSNAYYFGEPKTIVSGDGNNNIIIDEEMLQYEGISKSGQTGIVSSNDQTSIVFDYQYFEQLIFNSETDVKRLIASDSNKQKGNCLPDVINIENEIISNYGITAVNFCEMPVEMAQELRDVVAYIYDNFPNARNYLTNMTIANVGSSTYIAAFMPVFTFGTSKTSTGYPVAIKTQIILNAKYFLNMDKLTNSVAYGVKSGYFPRNANRSSAVAHEFGHYLSYIALLKYYNSDRLNFVRAQQSEKLYKVYGDFNEGKFSLALIKEAYNRFKTMYTTDMTFDEFRKSISEYAVAKDKRGAYIYDETIAEAFHDVYLNGEAASPASRMIFSVLKEKL